MRKILAALAGTLGGLVLLFSYPTSTNSSTAASVGGTGSPGTGSGSTSGSAAGSASGTQTYTGDAVDTRWGVVQVEITVEQGEITRSQAVRYPQDNPRDQEINSYALPVLAQEVTAAQSANIDAVSGATVTSDGYIRSLQSAIDQAHL